MRTAVAALLLAGLPLCVAGQNRSRSLHVHGSHARQLISLLVTGNESIATAVRDKGASRILLHDFEVSKGATFKYDADAPMYRLDIYLAQAKIGDAANPASLGEATALYQLFSSLGAMPDAAMEGTYLEATTIDCRIDLRVPFEKPERFVCDLSLPY